MTIIGAPPSYGAFRRPHARDMGELAVGAALASQPAIIIGAEKARARFGDLNTTVGDALRHSHLSNLHYDSPDTPGNPILGYKVFHASRPGSSVCAGLAPNPTAGHRFPRPAQTDHLRSRGNAICAHADLVPDNDWGDQMLVAHRRTAPTNWRLYGRSPSIDAGTARDARLDELV